MQIKPSAELEWSPCLEGQECARLLLPLDYTNTSDTRTVAIALHRITAPTRGTSAHRGAVFFNPGGPGGSGTFLTMAAGRLFGIVVGKDYDVLGFDPRGVGASTPRVDCFEDEAEREIWGVQGGYRFVDASDDTLTMYRARERLVGRRCEERTGGKDGIIRFVGTPSVARDMAEIAKKLGQDKVHYWGFVSFFSALRTSDLHVSHYERFQSYGTVLGQYFAAMFPDKVGRFVMDGVLDGYNYRDALWNSNLVDMEEVINSMFIICHLAGERCPIYEPSPTLVRARFLRTLDALKLSPVPVHAANPPFVITHTLLTMQLVLAAYRPFDGIRFVMSTARALETDDQEMLAMTMGVIPPTARCDCAAQLPTWIMPNEAFYAIACGDNPASGTFDPEIFVNVYERLVADSPHAGPFWSGYYLKCAEWPGRAAWRFTGPLEAKGANATANPMLIVQPRWDPVCPLRDARAVTERYEGAVILVQESYGHCTISAPSTCTMRAIQAYFQNGTLPKEGATCEENEVPFVGRVKAEAMDAEDAELVWATRKLVDFVPRFGMP